MSGIKHDQDKPDMSMISLELMEEVARVRMFGAKKYERDNWKKGFKVTRSCAAALRHIFQFLAGETNDPESGLSHLAHAVCCLEHGIHSFKNYDWADDRREPEPPRVVEIDLTKNQKSKVDATDEARLKQYSWHVTGNGYAATRITTAPKVNKIIFMHRFILGNPVGDVDHINGDKLDNRRCNLRVVTASENMFNKRIKKKHTSKYRGVSWFKSRNCWRATIMKEGKQTHLGYFSDEKDAYAAYVKAGIEIYGFDIENRTVVKEEDEKADRFNDWVAP